MMKTILKRIFITFQKIKIIIEKLCIFHDQFSQMMKTDGT